jgi:hypothetical protein
VPDHRDSFHFGRSEAVSLDQASKEVEEALGNASAIFGHAVSNDLRVLNIHGALTQNLQVFDTQDINKMFSKAVAGDLSGTSGLSSIAPSYLGDSAHDLSYHNAGNDIEVTGRILLKQANPAWVKEQYVDLTEHNERFKEELLRVGKENLSRCTAMFKKHFKEACNGTGIEVLELAESSPLQALDGFTLALDIKRRADIVKMVHTGVPLLDHLCQMEARDGGVTDLVNVISETSTEYASAFVKSREVMVEPSAHRQMIRIALESPEFVSTLKIESFQQLKEAMQADRDLSSDKESEVIEL